MKVQHLQPPPGVGGGSRGMADGNGRWAQPTCPWAASGCPQDVTLRAILSRGGCENGRLRCFSTLSGTAHMLPDARMLVFVVLKRGPGRVVHEIHVEERPQAETAGGSQSTAARRTPVSGPLTPAHRIGPACPPAPPSRHVRIGGNGPELVRGLQQAPSPRMTWKHVVSRRGRPAGAPALRMRHLAGFPRRPGHAEGRGLPAVATIALPRAGRGSWVSRSWPPEGLGQ
jgi:hypothetical protein